MITIRHCALLIALAAACGAAAAQTGTGTGAGTGGTGMGDAATGDTGAAGRTDSATTGTAGNKRKNADAMQKKSGAGASGSSGTAGTSGSSASKPGAVSDSDPSHDLTPGGVGASGTGAGMTAPMPAGPSSPANAPSGTPQSR